MRYGSGPAGGRFLRSGLSLDARGRELRDAWAPHLERSKAAQRRWAAMPETRGIDLAVAGAGRLADFDAPVFADSFQRWLLIDADPSSQSYWHGLGVRELEPRIGDLTGVAARWPARLDEGNRAAAGWAAALERIRNIAGTGDEPMAFAADAVLSLNVLSQLPLAWQDAAERYLERKFGARTTRANEEEWLAAVDAGGGWIVAQHLAALSRTRARSILLLTDIEYAEYRGGAAPEWEGGEWRAGAGVRVDVFPALYGVEMAVPGFQLDWHESWLWHISPFGRESREYGTVHRVGAFAFTARESVSPGTSLPRSR